MIKKRESFFERIKNRRKKKEEPKEEVKEETKLREIENITEEKRKQGLSEKLDDLTEKMDIIVEKQKLRKKKEFALPFGVRRQLNTLAQKDKVLVMLLKTNRAVQPVTAKINNGIIDVNGKYYDCSHAFIYLWLNKYPCIILPEWSLIPIGTKDYFDAMEEGNKADAQTIIIRMIENKENMERNKMPSKMVWWLLIGGIIVAYVLFGKG